MNLAVRCDECPSVRRRRRLSVEGFVSGSNTVVSHSYPIESDVHPFVVDEKRQFSGVEAGIHLVFVYSPVYIRSGGRALPIALIPSIAVIHSCRPGIFFQGVFFFKFVSTLVEILVRNEKPDSSKL